MNGFFQRRARKLKHRAVETVAPSDVRKALPRLGAFKRALRPAHPDRELELRMGQDFAVLLHQWGIQPREVPTVIKGLTIEACFYGVIALGLFALALFSASHGALIWAVLTLIWVFAAGMAVLVRIWRRWVLRTKRFMPFPRWLGLRG